MEKQWVFVALSGVPFPADRLYTYEAEPGLRAGTRVIVPFGRGNRHSEGIVMQCGVDAPGAACKPILTVLDEQPLLHENELRLVRWMKARYFCTYYEAVRAMLPAGLLLRCRTLYRLADGLDVETACACTAEGSPERSILQAVAEKGRELDELRLIAGEDADALAKKLMAQSLLALETEAARRINDKSVKIVSLAVPPEDAMAAVEARKKTAPMRYAVIEMLCTEGSLTSSDLCYYTGATGATLRSLKKSGLITMTAQELLRVPHYEAAATPKLVLNDEQQAALDGLRAALRAPAPRPALLHGVTASGKTQVYIRLIEETIALGRKALLLVPEIALTPQALSKFTAYFGDRVAMLHSALPLSERCDQWKRVRRGEVDIVLGTRSAVFAPLDSLGLVIIDEEQEPTYRSENAPRYDARDVALYRCAQEHALLLFGSATPTVETAYAAKTGNYQVFHLYRRFNEKALPQVEIVDLRQELRRGNAGVVSEPLREALSDAFSRGEQSILFLNRRGSARMLLCGECGGAPECPRCSVPMTYHSANGRLMCHYCGHSEPTPERCPDCGGLMKHIGFGTQKAEEELGELFPGKKILRMDADTVSGSGGHEKLLRRFEAEKIPILLGTQMIAKGLDFENVTLVGVLAADISLNVGNCYAPERTFNLLSQVVGRAGRGSRQGRALIQTYTPENDVIRAAAAQDYEAFYKSELRMRSLRSCPPFADVFMLTVTGLEEAHVLRAALSLRDGLRAAMERPALRALHPEVLGPAPAPVVKVNNRYRYHVYIVGENNTDLRRLVAEFLHAFYQHRENRGLSIFADCNAQE